MPIYSLGMADCGKNIHRKKSASVLYRSRIEMGRILKSLAKENIAIFADIGEKGDEQLFVSHVLSAEPDEGHFTIAYGLSKSINARLFDQPSLKIKANYQGGRISFVATKPSDTIFEGHPAIQFNFPRALLHYYREHKRISVPKDASMRCLLYEEGSTKSFELRVVDISQDGMGCLLYKGRYPLLKGSVLRNCQIVLPSGEIVTTDLMVRYTKPITMRDGTIVNRTGVRFVQRPEEIAALIYQFVQYIDDAELGTQNSTRSVAVS